MPDSGDEHEVEAMQHQQQPQQDDPMLSPLKQQQHQQQQAEPFQQQASLLQQLQVAIHPQQQQPPTQQQQQQPTQQPTQQQPTQPQQQYIPHISEASQVHKTLHTTQQQQQTEQRLLVDQQQQHERQQRQAKQEQVLQDADAKLQAAEALNSAFCRYIYSTALQYLQQRCSTEDLEKQFLDILDKDDPFDQPCTVAHQDVNSCKNRYRDVVPYDHNRVCLPPAPPPRPPAGTDASSSQAAAAAAAAATAAAAAAASKAALGLPGGSAATNYINASFMSDPHLTGDHAALQGYIATQGPLPATVIDFWRMVAATNASAIVMLTGLSDGSPKFGSSKPRCAAYFPEKEQDVLRLPGGARVTCVHKNHLDDNVYFRQLEVVWADPAAPAPAAAAPAGSSGGQQPGSTAAAAAAGGSSSSSGRQQPSLPQQPSQSQQQLSQPPSQQQQQPRRLWINHYEYAGWPDYGVPPTTASVLALCHALDGCRRAGCKIVVHCSAGVGRTGTFIAIDVLLQRLHSLSLQLHGSVGQQEVVAAVNVPELIINLRQQRRGMVQTWEQYSFVWQAVINELQALLQQQEQQQPGQQGQGQPQQPPQQQEQQPSQQQVQPSQGA